VLRFFGVVQVLFSSCLAQVSVEVLKVCSQGSLGVDRVPAVIADRYSFLDGTS